jgi:hypothetical protein
MLRRILLAATASAASFALTACSGYLLYRISEGWGEGRLSLLIRFIFNPIIAALVGVLVGLLSKDHPALTSIVGLVPWALMLHGLKSAGTLRGNLIWMAAVAVCFVFAASSAILAWRFRRGRKNSKSRNVSMGVTHT